MRNSECGMRNKKQKTISWIIVGVVASIACMVLSTSWAGSAPAAPSVEELRAEVQALRQEAATLEEENRGLRKILADQEDGELYVVVDTESNRLTLRQGETVLHTAVVGTGSRH